MSAGMAPFKKTQYEGAVSTTYAATVTEEGAVYLPQAIGERGSELARDKGLGERLMNLTRR